MLCKCLKKWLLLDAISLLAVDGVQPLDTDSQLDEDADGDDHNAHASPPKKIKPEAHKLLELASDLWNYNDITFLDLYRQSFIIAHL